MASQCVSNNMMFNTNFVILTVMFFEHSYRMTTHLYLVQRDTLKTHIVLIESLFGLQYTFSPIPSTPILVDAAVACAHSACLFNERILHPLPVNQRLADANALMLTSMLTTLDRAQNNDAPAGGVGGMYTVPGFDQQRCP